MKKCNRDCFNCIHDDCIIETPTKEEREMQNYRDACATVTGRIRRAHGGGGSSKSKSRGGFYGAVIPKEIWEQES